MIIYTRSNDLKFSRRSSEISRPGSQGLIPSEGFCMKIIGHAAIVWLAFLSVTFSSCIKSGEVTQSPNRGLNQPA